jgi:hypothetical protein
MKRLILRTLRLEEAARRQEIFPSWDCEVSECDILWVSKGVRFLLWSRVFTDEEIAPLRGGGENLALREWYVRTVRWIRRSATPGRSHRSFEDFSRIERSRLACYRRSSSHRAEPHSSSTKLNNITKTKPRMAPPGCLSKLLSPGVASSETAIGRTRFAGRQVLPGIVTRVPILVIIAGFGTGVRSKARHKVSSCHTLVTNLRVSGPVWYSRPQLPVSNLWNHAGH